ncbi:nitroreductase family protein [Nocardiopsis sp. MG754419]|uniref:nitroreductase family protein n=1 Tax=Nocardiopsis sp. MG754419 TaxID=2259865 RepID=UPI002010DF7D|nr:nitroreductase family protein [Nocardiopsis sp. MG754419]
MTTAVPTPVTDGADPALVREYLYDVHYRWQAIFAEGQGGLDDPDRPPLFTRPESPRRRYALPSRPRHRIGPLGAALREESSPEGARLAPGPPASPDPALLGELLFYGYGFSRVDQGPQVEWPWHRTVASARCFYPVEMAVWSADAPEGVHRYDAAHHELSELRDDVGARDLAAAAAADLDGARTVLVLTARLGKVAFRYRNYAYRLVTQEAGLIAGNLLVVASALGLRGQLRLRFLDEALARLLALPEDDSEAVLAVVPLWDAEEAPEAPGHRPAVPDTRGSAPVPVAGGNGIDPVLSARALAVERASWLRAPEELAPVDAGTRTPFRGAEPVAVAGDVPLTPLRRASSTDTGLAVVRRDSGPDVFLPTARPLPLGVVSDVLLDAVRPLRSDLWHDASPPEVGVHAIAGSVTDLPRGHYRLVDGALRPVSNGDLRPRLQEMDVWRTEINAKTAPLLAVVTADAERLLEHHPRRAFRATQALTGLVTQRISLAAAAHGLSARVTNSYDADEFAALLGLDLEREIPVFLLVLGYPNAPWHLATRVRP